MFSAISGFRCHIQLKLWAGYIIGSNQNLTKIWCAFYICYLNIIISCFTVSRVRQDDTKYHLIAVKDTCVSHEDLEYHLLPGKDPCFLQAEKSSDCGSCQSVL